MDITQFNEDLYQNLFLCVVLPLLSIVKDSSNIINAWQSSLAVYQPSEEQSAYLAARCNE